MFAYFSVVILSFGDFSRYVRDESQLKKGNFILILNLLIFSFFALFIVSGMDAFLKQDPENLNRILTNEFFTVNYAPPTITGIATGNKFNKRISGFISGENLRPIVFV